MNTSIPNPTNGQKLNWQKYQANYRQFILESIEADELEEWGFPDSEQGRIDYIRTRFEREGSRASTRIDSIANWLQGLALDLPFYYEEILELSVSMGSASPVMTDKEEEKIISNYWVFMANQISKLIYN